MTDLFAARSQMAISLGFHIVFAVIDGDAVPDGDFTLPSGSNKGGDLP
jgi:hypothetical protein